MTIELLKKGTVIDLHFAIRIFLPKEQTGSDWRRAKEPLIMHCLRLQREKISALVRERRAKKNMQALLEELKDKNLINEELKDKLECYRGKTRILH